ncbi:hypothetical protein FTX61_21415 [Nitriliruptoraceae bacterium ZYF776]|jgi:hypothetical protein|nr:hypothetical protein [Profundirhabdus halotolerans]
MDDPGLLLSTTATASAALVAIVGGLLVARVVSLATERSGLLHRRDELVDRLQHAESRHVQLADRLFQRDVGKLIHSHRRFLATLPEDPDVQAMLEAAGVSRRADEIEDHIAGAIGHLSDIREELEPLFSEGRPERDFWDHLVRKLIEPPAHETFLWEAMFNQLASEQPVEYDAYGSPKRYPARLSDDVSRINNHLREQDERASYDRLRADVGAAADRVSSLALELDHARSALDRVSHPVGVGWGVTVLSYFSAVGILVPLVLMLVADDLSTTALGFMIGGFASGLGALILYVVLSVNHLTTD